MAEFEFVIVKCCAGFADGVARKKIKHLVTEPHRILKKMAAGLEEAIEREQPLFEVRQPVVVYVGQ